MNLNSVWATEKAAPVSRSGFGIIPANLFYCTTTRKIVSILRTEALQKHLHLDDQKVAAWMATVRDARR